MGDGHRRGLEHPRDSILPNGLLGLRGVLGGPDAEGVGQGVALGRLRGDLFHLRRNHLCGRSGDNLGRAGLRWRFCDGRRDIRHDSGRLDLLRVIFLPIFLHGRGLGRPVGLHIDRRSLDHRRQRRLGFRDLAEVVLRRRDQPGLDLVGADLFGIGRARLRRHLQRGTPLIGKAEGLVMAGARIRCQWQADSSWTGGIDSGDIGPFLHERQRVVHPPIVSPGVPPLQGDLIIRNGREGVLDRQGGQRAEVLCVAVCTWQSRQGNFLGLPFRDQVVGGACVFATSPQHEARRRCLHPSRRGGWLHRRELSQLHPHARLLSAPRRGRWHRLLCGPCGRGLRETRRRRRAGRRHGSRAPVATSRVPAGKIETRHAALGARDHTDLPAAAEHVDEALFPVRVSSEERAEGLPQGAARLQAPSCPLPTQPRQHEIGVFVAGIGQAQDTHCAAKLKAVRGLCGGLGIGVFEAHAPECGPDGESTLGIEADADRVEQAVGATLIVELAHGCRDVPREGDACSRRKLITDGLQIFDHLPRHDDGIATVVLDDAHAREGPPARQAAGQLRELGVAEEDLSGALGPVGAPDFHGLQRHREPPAEGPAVDL